MSIDIRLIPDLHDKTAEDMLVELAADYSIVVASTAAGWKVMTTYNGVIETDKAPTLYEAVLSVYERVNPPADAA